MGQRSAPAPIGGRASLGSTLSRRPAAIGGFRAVRRYAPSRASSLRSLLPQLVRGLDMLFATLVTIGPRRDSENARQSVFCTAPILVALDSQTAREVDGKLRLRYATLSRLSGWPRATQRRSAEKTFSLAFPFPIDSRYTAPSLFGGGGGGLPRGSALRSVPRFIAPLPPSPTGAGFGHAIATLVTIGPRRDSENAHKCVLHSADPSRS